MSTKSKAVDMTGLQFGRLTVSYMSEHRKGKTYWVCTCECGKITSPISRSSLMTGRTKSCGCLSDELKGPRDDLTGQTFGYLTVIATGPVRGKSREYIFRCVCGNLKPARKDHLRNNRVTSCGCKHQEVVEKHGHARGGQITPEYTVWCAMVSRCTNTKNNRWYRYGARGISVCPEWSTFEGFIKDMGLRPSPDHSIERKDNDLGYSADNCVWATRSEQARNKSSNRLLTYLGETRCLVEWCERLNLCYATVIQRLNTYGWSVYRAFETPTNKPFAPSKLAA